MRKQEGVMRLGCLARVARAARGGAAPARGGCAAECSARVGRAQAAGGHGACGNPGSGAELCCPPRPSSCAHHAFTAVSHAGCMLVLWSGSREPGAHGAFGQGQASLKAQVSTHSRVWAVRSFPAYTLRGASSVTACSISSHSPLHLLPPMPSSQAPRGSCAGRMARHGRAASLARSAAGRAGRAGPCAQDAGAAALPGLTACGGGAANGLARAWRAAAAARTQGCAHPAGRQACFACRALFVLRFGKIIERQAKARLCRVPARTA